MMIDTNSDWRADITGHDTLDDLDSIEVMTYLRHQYLISAKDLVKDIPQRCRDDLMIGIRCSVAAESLQLAIETMENET